MQIDDGAGNREAEPHSAEAVIARQVALLEGQKDFLQRGRGSIPIPESATSIAEPLSAPSSLVRIVIVPPRGVNFTALRKQVPDDLLEARRIRDQAAVLRGQIPLERDAFGQRVVAHDLDRQADERMRVA